MLLYTVDMDTIWVIISFFKREKQVSTRVGLLMSFPDDAWKICWWRPYDESFLWKTFLWCFIMYFVVLIRSNFFVRLNTTGSLWYTTVTLSVCIDQGSMPEGSRHLWRRKSSRSRCQPVATQGAPGVLEEGEWSAELLPPTTAATKVPAGMWFPMSPFVGLNSSGGHSLRTKAQRTQPPRRRATTLPLAEEEEEGPPPSGHRRKEVKQVLKKKQNRGKRGKKMLKKAKS